RRWRGGVAGVRGTDEGDGARVEAVPRRTPLGGRDPRALRRHSEEPFPLLGEPIAQRHTGFPPQALAREVDRGSGMARLAWRSGEVPSPRLYPADLTKSVQDPVDCHPAAAAK